MFCPLTTSSSRGFGLEFYARPLPEISKQNAIDAVVIHFRFNYLKTCTRCHSLNIG